ncbi:MAG TPA: citrate synthase [Ktedonobacteraceae bacterium]|nr:citrate synthase [Ktedonobacteraceae bacterium]
MAESSTLANEETRTPQQRKGGLEGVVAATTSISNVDGEAGHLVYRGYDIHDLAHTTTFEEIAYLLWFGHLPTRAELAGLQASLKEQRHLPAGVLALLRNLPADTSPMDALRTAVSAWGMYSHVRGAPTVEQAIALTGCFPLILTTFHRLRQGLEPLEPRADLGHTANYLYLLTGQEPKAEHVKGLDAYLVMLADHSMNASTFTARIVASTTSDLASAVVAAICALKGPLHGGAADKSYEMLEAIGSAENAEPWIRATLARGGRLMGFGHRAYKTTDPRAEELREMARHADPAGFAFARRVEELALAILEETKPGRRLYTNVDFYSAVLLNSVGIPVDLFTPTFAVSRVAGWTAHILEQTANNRLIRPLAEYTGPDHRAFVALAQR